MDQVQPTYIYLSRTCLSSQKLLHADIWIAMQDTFRSIFVYKLFKEKGRTADIFIELLHAVCVEKG